MASYVLVDEGGCGLDSGVIDVTNCGNSKSDLCADVSFGSHGWEELGRSSSTLSSNITMTGPERGLRGKVFLFSDGVFEISVRESLSMLRYAGYQTE